MFESAKLKIKRANQHIADLETHLTTFTRQNLDASIKDTGHGQADITLTVLTPAPEIALTIGDAVHNLFSALDHLIWELVGSGGQHKELYFPTGRDRQSYEGICNGMKAPAAIKDLFKSLEAFAGGKGELLYIVKTLDRADKHRVLTPVINAPGLDELILVGDGGNIRRSLSDLCGSDEQLREGCTLTIDGAPSGFSLAFKDDAKISPHILFGKVEFLQDQPILPTLRKLRYAVADTIKIVEAAIS